MTREQYILLYEKSKNGLCTPEEQRQLLEYTNDFELLDIPWDEHIHGDEQNTKAAIYAKLDEQISAIPKTRTLWVTKWAATAIILFTLSVGIYNFVKRGKAPATVTYANNNISKPITPCGNKAILRLANGAVITLNNAKNGVIANIGNAYVKKTREGELVYGATGQAAGVDPSAMNTISTPKGGQYQLTLPDGSKVWLNAGSSLSFPTAFTGNSRQVSLKGEAYFEVAKNKAMPFKINVNSMQVQVLGTHFNVMAYDDEANIKTTLLEGSVKIAGNNVQAMLKPGQQAVFNKLSNKVNVANVNANDAVAWKNGYFLFAHEDIKSVMRQISRWYDVDVSYDKELPDDLFEGSINRFVNVQKVLDMLELTGQVHFKIAERRIIVTK